MDIKRLVALFAAVIAATAAPASGGPQKPKKYTLTISGGISLGAYEAGLNWAMVQVIKTHRGEMELAGVSGASAGSMNAVATGVMWLEKEGQPVEDLKGRPAPQGLENNLLWNTWIPIGLEHLFPVDASCREYAADYRKTFGMEPDCALINRADPDNSIFPWTAYTEYNDYAHYISRDGLFTRNAFTYAAREMEQVLSSSGRFEQGQAFPVGITLTRARPVPQHFNGLEIKSQRYVLPLVLKENGGKLSASPQTGNARISGQLILPPFPDENAEGISHKELIYYVIASTAFPGVFGPVGLYYCDEPGNAPPAGGAIPPDYSCAQYGETTTKTLVKGQFLDGGVFDNLPLSLSMEQIAAVPEGETVSHLVINPDFRRAVKPAVETAASATKDLSGSIFLADFTKGFFDSARQYELYATYRALQNSPRPVAVTLFSRFSPITGEYLYNFGAFMEIDFRKYDYYAGVYDALRGLAASHCRDAPPYRSVYDCIGMRMDDFAKDLEIPRHAEAYYVFRLLAALENRLSPPEGEPEQTPLRFPACGGNIPFAAMQWRAGPYGIAPFPGPLSEAIASNNLSAPPAWRWTALSPGDAETMSKTPVGVIMQTLFETGLCARADGEPTARYADMNEFIAGLKRNNYPFDENNKYLREVRADYDKWRKTMLVKAAERTRQVEEKDNNPIGAISASITEYSMLSLWGTQHRRGWTDEAAIPSRLYRETESNDLIRTLSYLMPYSIDMDLTGNGPAVNWNLGSYIIDDNYLLRFPVGYQSAQRANDDYFSIGVLFTRRISDSLLFSSVAAGPAIFQNAAYAPDVHTGGVVQLGLFLDKLRITAGVRDLAKADIARQGNWNEWFISLGFYDVRNVFYWMSKGAKTGAPDQPDNGN